MLLDSNVIIYSFQPQHHTIRDFIAQRAPAISMISYAEVAGYHTHPD